VHHEIYQDTKSSDRINSFVKGARAAPLADGQSSICGADSEVRRMAANTLAIFRRGLRAAVA